jgi:hypothetical protein
VFRLTPLGLGAQLRTSTYDGSSASGRLVSGSLEVNPWNLFRLEASAGTRTDRHPAGDLTTRALTWRGLDADFALARSLFVVLSAYQEQGDLGPSRQGYAAISWRFAAAGAGAAWPEGCLHTGEVAGIWTVTSNETGDARVLPSCSSSAWP